jgi:N-methylhydantoinase B
MREGVAKIPDGTYEAESFLDEDGVRKDTPVSLRVKVIVKGTDVTVDYSDLSPQVQGPINSGGVSGLAVARIGIKSLIVPVDPADEGSFRPIHVILPPGKLVSAGRPAAIAQWSAALASLIDTIFKALNCAIPDKVPAGSRNDVGGIQIYGRGPGEFWYYHQACPGGWGALSTSDGPCGLKSLNHGDSYVIPTEVIESRSPIRIEREELRQDSGGAGKFRGGLGTRRVFRVLKDGVGNLTMHRGNFPPWGLAGGKPGAPDTFVVELPGQKELQLTRAKDISLPVGSRVTVLTAGGGGWGNPLERDSKAVEADLVRGYISREKAIEDYGVSLDPATGACRKRQGTAALRENAPALT